MQEILAKMVLIIERESIRDLVLQYSRAIDRKDAELLADLYTEDATDKHGDDFDGSGQAFVKLIEQRYPNIRYSGHHVCNHLISVDGDRGEGEVYALAYHIVPDAQGDWHELVMAVRYIDNYRKEADGRWRFSKRVVTYDMYAGRPYVDPGEGPDILADPSYRELSSEIFARGVRR